MPVMVNAARSNFEYVFEPDDGFLKLWTHRYDFIHAPHTEPGDRPQWQTESRYPLSDRIIQQGAYLYGVRFGSQTRYCLLDIDIDSYYHPSRDPLAIERMVAALEPLGLVSYIACTSSYSQGLHLYFPLNTAVSSWKLSAVITALLECQGFNCAPGQLEVFPNRKLYVLDGTPNLFNAHRLPLQAGSYLLNSQLEPISSSKEVFVRQWHHCERQNAVDIPNIDRLLKQLRRRTYQVSQRADKFLNDLNAEIEIGWTGPGQTNYLLGRITMRCYIFHHVLRGGQPLCGEALVNEIVSVASALPGYREWCRHQHEIRKRAEEWARCIENSHYFPYGNQHGKYKAKFVQQSQNDQFDVGMTWNQQRSLIAQTKIQNSVEQLWTEGKLAVTATARFQQLVACGIGGSTLYKYKTLWHPNLWNPPQTPPTSKKVEASAMATPAIASHAPSLLSGVDRNATHTRVSSSCDGTARGDDGRNDAERSTWRQALAQLKQRQMQQKRELPLCQSPQVAKKPQLLGQALAEKMRNYLRSQDPILMKEGLAWLVQQNEMSPEQFIPADIERWISPDEADPRLKELIEVCGLLLSLRWSPLEIRHSLETQFGRSTLAALSREDLCQWCECLRQRGGWNDSLGERECRRLV